MKGIETIEKPSSLVGFEHQPAEAVATRSGRGSEDVVVQSAGVGVRNNRGGIQSDFTSTRTGGLDQLAADDRAVVIGVGAGEHGCDGRDEVARFVTEDADGGGADEGDAGDDQAVFDEALALLVTQKLTKHQTCPSRHQRRKRGIENEK